MELKEVIDLLPKVGDRYLEVLMTAEKKKGKHVPEAKPCTVVEVHPGRLWYRVIFDCGFSECYKVPVLESGVNDKRRR